MDARADVDPQQTVAGDTSSALPKHNKHRKGRRKCTYEHAKRQRNVQVTESSAAAINSDTSDSDFDLDEVNPQWKEEILLHDLHDSLSEDTKHTLALHLVYSLQQAFQHKLSHQNIMEFAANTVGTTVSTIYRWKNKYELNDCNIAAVKRDTEYLKRRKTLLEQVCCLSL